jgi:hypothetical protein
MVEDWMERPDHTRTIRLLEARLEVLAIASERVPSGGQRLEPAVRGVEVATRHAVRLDLLSPEEAGSIWAGVARRHPGVTWCRGGPSLAT